MSRSSLPRTAGARRRAAAVAFAVALPLTMAAGCQDEGTVEPGIEQEEGVEEEEGMEEEQGGTEEGEGTEEEDD